MAALEGFEPVAEVTADERARVAVGRAGAHKDDRYDLSVNDDGAILLTPLASIPKRELLVWENAELRVLHCSAVLPKRLKERDAFALGHRRYR